MVVFFIRRFNDIDHIAPIIYKMAELGNAQKLLLLSQNPDLDIEDDFRLAFLRKQYGVEIKYVYDYFAPTWLYRLAAFVICKKPHGFFGVIIKKVLRKWMNDARVKMLFNVKWAQELFKKINPSVLVFDWVKSEQHVTGALVEGAKKLGIPTISVPHGMNMMVNDLQRDKEVERGTPENFGEKYNMFDYFVVQFERYKEACVKRGMTANKIAVLGSTRYCAEWRKVYQRIAPVALLTKLPNHKGKLKLVFMETPYNYRIHKNTVVDNIARIAKLDFIDLVIKPHTRSNRLFANELRDSAQIVDDIPSMALCQWADVVIGTSSSILLEPLMNGKILLYPKYFHDNTMDFEVFNACWQVNSYEELESAMTTLQGNHAYNPYLKENVEKLLIEVVYGGKKERDVLKEYVDFIMRVRQA